jgi:hypothetical protein
MADGRETGSAVFAANETASKFTPLLADAGRLFEWLEGTYKTDKERLRGYPELYNLVDSILHSEKKGKGKKMRRAIKQDMERFLPMIIGLTEAQKSRAKPEPIERRILREHHHRLGTDRPK